MPYIDIRNAQLSRGVIDLFDIEYLDRHRVVPIQIKSGVLWLGVTDPLRVSIQDEVLVITGYDVK
ncbi:MAG: hypothetical protein O3B01_26580 [Planctomycetota bacterium]|nr:hypothetical protein [Planctomycetota bacterium]